MSEVVDLWPDFGFELIRSPKSVLKEQADLLSQKTNNVLKGELRINQTLSSAIGVVKVDFEIVAPYLGNYRYKLISIEYNHVNLYPVSVLAEGQSTNGTYAKYESNNEPELIDDLKEILRSFHTKKIINSLYSQSLEETENV